MHSVDKPYMGINMKLRVVLACIGLMAVLCGCDVGDNKAEAQGTASHFDIPLTLVEEMQASASHAICSPEEAEGRTFDAYVYEGLINCGMSKEEASEIAWSPRGKMKFADDGFTYELRLKIWPDITKFEDSLRSSLKETTEGYCRVDEKGCLKDRCATFRWVNAEIEKRAIKEMDYKFSRLSDAEFSRVLRNEKPYEGEIAWRIAPNILFVKSSVIDNEWQRREYIFLTQPEEDVWMPIARFESFPSLIEATQALVCMINPRALNNIAVLAWDRRVDLKHFNPYTIMDCLQFAAENGVVEAKQNLEILYLSFPQLREGGGVQ